MPPWKAARVEWDRWSHNNESPISRIFGGQHRSQLRCEKCKFTSTSYESFYSIPLEIDIKRGKKVTIHECLRSYTAEEVLDKDNNWKCPNCKQVRKTTKKLTITRAPQVLVIQFKRFSAQSDGYTAKSKTLVDFPLNHLDITQFVAEPPRPDGSGQELPEPEEATRPPFDYQVFGVVNHYGTLTGGHYKAVVRDPNKGDNWTEFDDSRPDKFPTKHVVVS
jgi:ubiquitin carboxyl-terminal hydrolase 8